MKYIAFYGFDILHYRGIKSNCLDGHFRFNNRLFVGLERKISVRTSKEELIERGILLPGEVGVWSGDPAPWQGPLPTTSINSNTPTPTTHYNTLPLPNNNTTGKPECLLFCLLFIIS